MIHNPAFSNFLNASRWFAAFLVLIGHVRHLVLVDYKHVVEKTAFTKALYFITGFGHESVIIFFVLSGYLVGASTLFKWRHDGYDVPSYLAARISRIYITLIPAMISTLVLDYVGLNWYNQSELYTNSAQYSTVSLNSTIANTLSFPIFVSNLFNLQGVLTGTFGSNAPLWSLAYEWWYYCAFGLVGVGLVGNGKIRLLATCAAICLMVALPFKMALWGSIWCLGFLAFTWIQAGARGMTPTVGLLIFTVVMTASRLSHNVENLMVPESDSISFFRDFSLGCSFVIALVGMSKSCGSARLLKMNSFVAEFSYSTYLFHFPALVFSVAFLYEKFGIKFQQQPTFGGISYFLGLIIFLYLYCYASYLIAEKYTGRVRQRLLLILRRLMKSGAQNSSQ